MAVMQSVIFATALFFVIFFKEGASIRCFVCNSHFDLGCAQDNPSAELAVDCPMNYAYENTPSTFCRKIHQTIEFSRNGGSAIRCFECNSYNDSKCAMEVVPAELSIECGDHYKGVKYSFCRKTKQIIEFSVNQLPADTRIIRGCGWDDSNYKNKCYQRSGFGGRQEVCACDTDNCNGSSMVHISTYTIGLSIILFIVYLMRN